MGPKADFLWEIRGNPKKSGFGSGGARGVFHSQGVRSMTQLVCPTAGGVFNDHLLGRNHRDRISGTSNIICHKYHLSLVGANAPTPPYGGGLAPPTPPIMVGASAPTPP